MYQFYYQFYNWIHQFVFILLLFWFRIVWFISMVRCLVPFDVWSSSTHKIKINYNPIWQLSNNFCSGFFFRGVFSVKFVLKSVHKYCESTTQMIMNKLLLAHEWTNWWNIFSSCEMEYPSTVIDSELKIEATCVHSTYSTAAKWHWLDKGLNESQLRPEIKKIKCTYESNPIWNWKWMNEKYRRHWEENR